MLEFKCWSSNAEVQMAVQPMPEELIAASRHLGDDLVPNNPAGNEDAGGHADDNAAGHAGGNAGGHAGGHAEERSSAGDGKDGCPMPDGNLDAESRCQPAPVSAPGSVPAPRPLLHVREGVRDDFFFGSLQYLQKTFLKTESWGFSAPGPGGAVYRGLPPF